MKQSLQLRLSQHLALTPQLQQSIRLLQLSTLELNQEIEQALQENPLLEREDIGEAGAYTPVRRCPVARFRRPGGDREQPAREADERCRAGLGQRNAAPAQGSRDPEMTMPTAVRFKQRRRDLREHLNAQLALTQLAETRAAYRRLPRRSARRRRLPDPDAGRTWPNPLPATPTWTGRAGRGTCRSRLRHLQHLDPPGIGARSPQECLDLQLAEPARLVRAANSPASSSATISNSSRRETFVTHQEGAWLRRRRVARCPGADPFAQSAAGCPVRAARHALRDSRRDGAQGARRLDCQPQQRGDAAAAHQPPLRRYPAESARRARRRPSGSLAGQLQEAKWLIKNVQQRFDTIQRVAQAIVERQRAFFDHGEVAMRPLTLREIADTVSLHESTISRVTTQKYLASPRGIFELKYFFGSHVATDTRRRCFFHRDPRADQAAGRRRRRPQAALRRQDRGNPRRAGHRGGATNRRQVPRVPQHSAGQPQKSTLRRQHEHQHHRSSRRSHPGIARLRHGQGRSGHSPFRPCHQRPCDPVGGKAQAEGRNHRCTSRARTSTPMPTIPISTPPSTC